MSQDDTTMTWKEFRESNDITITKLIEQMQTEDPTFSYFKYKSIETGIREPKSQEMKAFCQVFADYDEQFFQKLSQNTMAARQPKEELTTSIQLESLTKKEILEKLNQNGANLTNTKYLAIERGVRKPTKIEYEAFKKTFPEMDIDQVFKGLSESFVETENKLITLRKKKNLSRQQMVDIMNRYGKIMTYRKLQAIENNQRGELLGREMAALRLAFPEDVDDRFFFGPLPEPDSKQ